MNPPDPRPLLTSLDFEPKTYDIDFAGIVSNRVHVTWLEDLRLAMLARYLPLQGLLADGMAPVILSTHIQYRAPVRLFDRIRGHMWLVRLGRGSWEVAAEFVHTDSGRQVASGSQQGVFVHLDGGRPARVPDGLRRLFEEAAGGTPPPPA